MSIDFYYQSWKTSQWEQFSDIPGKISLRSSNILWPFFYFLRSKLVSAISNTNNPLEEDKTQPIIMVVGGGLYESVKSAVKTLLFFVLFCTLLPAFVISYASEYILAFFRLFRKHILHTGRVQSELSWMLLPEPGKNLIISVRYSKPTHTTENRSHVYSMIVISWWPA